MTHEEIGLSGTPKKSVTIVIDGRKCRADEGEIVLSAALREGAAIPHLCYEASLDPYGACRLCMVEVCHNGKTSMVTACTLHATEGLEIRTDTPEIVKYRNVLFELYLAEAPKSDVIKEMAARYGVTRTRFLKKIDTDDPLGGSCVLCGLCVRVCNEIMGAGAIGFVNRGPYTVVGTPFFEANTDCIGCGACANVCPTHAIRIEDRDGERVMHSWGGGRVRLAQCGVCGKYYAPGALTAATLARLLPPLRDDLAGLCPACRAKRIADEEIRVNMRGGADHHVRPRRS
ncbi:MAG: bidirectional [NiFe] hydrogenase diaphorase subunit [Methanofollis sp.]|nr:bidirectional [NiFe] hydrogenase diaphorase subunit [Methanofollis sp.]